MVFRRARLASLFVIALVVTGCSTADSPNQFAHATAPATPRATPLAVAAPTATATANPKVTPKPKPTAKPGPYYKPRGWNGSSDVNCSDFDTHAHAQSFFKGTGGSSLNDPYGLDGDHDGTACETLP